MMNLRLPTAPQFELTYLLTKFTKSRTHRLIIQEDNTNEDFIEDDLLMTRTGVIDTNIPRREYRLSTMGLRTASMRLPNSLKSTQERLDFTNSLEGKVALINAQRCFSRSVEANLLNQRIFVRAGKAKEAIKNIHVDRTPTEAIQVKEGTDQYSNAKKELARIEKIIEGIIPAEYFTLTMNLTERSEKSYMNEKLAKDVIERYIGIALNIKGDLFHKDKGHILEILGANIDEENDLSMFMKYARLKIISYARTVMKEDFEPDEVNQTYIKVDSSIVAQIIAKKLIMDRKAGEELTIDDVLSKVNQYKLGTRIFPTHVNIDDKATIVSDNPSQTINRMVDDEGVRPIDYTAISKGILQERPSSRIIDGSQNRELKSNGRGFIYDTPEYTDFGTMFANLVISIEKPAIANLHKFIQGLDEDFIIGIGNAENIQYLEEENMFTIDGLVHKFNIRTHQDDLGITHHKNTFSRLRDLTYSVETYSLFNDIIATSERSKTYLFSTEEGIYYSVTAPDIIVKPGTGDLNKTRSDYRVIPELIE